MCWPVWHWFVDHTLTYFNVMTFKWWRVSLPVPPLMFAKVKWKRSTQSINLRERWLLEALRSQHSVEQLFLANHFSQTNNTRCVSLRHFIHASIVFFLLLMSPLVWKRLVESICSKRSKYLEKQRISINSGFSEESRKFVHWVYVYCEVY